MGLVFNDHHPQTVLSIQEAEVHFVWSEMLTGTIRLDEARLTRVASRSSSTKASGTPPTCDRLVQTWSRAHTAILVNLVPNYWRAMGPLERYGAIEPTPEVVIHPSLMISGLYT